MKTPASNPKLAKIRTSWRPFATLAAVMVAGGVLATPSAMAANTYFGTNNVAGTGYDQNGAYWGITTSQTGGSAMLGSDQWTFGINAVDFGAVNGFAAGPYAYTINLDSGGSDNPGTIAINATNLAVTFSGTANTHFTGAVAIVVTNYSTLIWTANNGNGSFNWNGEAATFLGPGTNIFEDQICGANNKAALATQGTQAGGAANNVTIILNQTIGVPPGYHLSGGYVLYSGNLIFANATACADAFGSFSSGKLFQIGWGTGAGNPNPIIDNTSGSAQTLSLGSGTYSLAGNFTFQGSSSLNLGNYAVALTASPVITIGGSVLSIGGAISGTGFGLTMVGPGTLQLAGANTYSGPTLALGGTLQLTNSGAISSSLLVSNATFDISGLASPEIALSSSLSLSNNPTLVVSGISGATNIIAATLNVDGTPVTVNVNALPPITGYPTIFPIVKGTTVNGTLNFILGTLPPSGGNPYTGYVTNIAASGLAEFVLTNGPTPVFSVTWSGKNGGTASGTWDVQNTPDWLYLGSPIVFNQGDVTAFSDLSNGGSNIVNMTTIVQPSTLTISNNATPYTFTSNGGYLANNSPGTLTLTKQGPGTLTLQESGDSFSGGINVSGGTVVVDNNSSGITGGTTIAAGATVQLGNNDLNDQLPQGGVTVNGSLVFNCADIPTTVSSTLVGTGAVMQVSTNTVLLNDSGTSSGNWSTVITNGTLQPGDSSALGSLPGGTVTITNGGTLDVGGSQGGQNYLNFGAKEFIVSGAGVNGGGAIINSSANEQEDAFQNIVLTNNATFGGPYRWDIRNGTPVLNLNGYTLTVTNISTLALVSARVTPGNIIVQNGANLDFEETCNVTNPGTITVESGGALGIYASTLGSITMNVVLNGGGLTNISGANETAYLDSPVLMQQSSVIGNLNAGTITYYDGTISDGGNGLSLTAGGQSTNYLSGTNTYSGPTVISGTFLGLNSQGSINSSSQIIVTNGGIFDLSRSSLPFSGTNTLILGDDNNGQGILNLGSSIITNFNSLSLVNPILSMAVPNPGNPNITVTNLYLGDGQGLTIIVTALPPVLTSLQFPLIKYINVTGTYNFNSESLPPGYSGNLSNNIVNKSIDLVITALPPGVWNGGGAPADNYWDDLANWSGTALSGSDALVFAGSAGLNNTNDMTSETATSITFASNAGAFVLNPSNNVSLTLSGNIVNDSTATETINMPMSFGVPALVNGASGPLDINGGVTNTDTGVNSLMLAGTGTLVDLFENASSAGSNELAEVSLSANWTIVDNPGSAAITVPWALEITNGTLNFGTALSAPNFTSTTVHNVPSDSQVGAGTGYSTLNVVNGTLALNTLNTGQALDTTDTVNVAGGTLSLGAALPSDYFQGANGGNAGELSVVTISGNGIMTCDAGGAFWVASRGDGIVTITNSGSLTCGTFDLSRNAQGNTFSSIGVVNLSGGAITCSHVGTADSASQSGPPTSGPSPSATFNFNGGILRAVTNSATFYQGNTASPAIPIQSFVLAGGAFLDTSNWAITVLEPLQSGATPDGGLTKLGTGTLTLTRTNTYNGPTVISAGTLALSGTALIATTPEIIAAGGSTVDVSALTSPFALGTSQVFSNSSSTVTINCGAVGASFPASSTLALNYTSGAPLSVGSGVLSLAAGTVVKIINNSGTPLGAGVYPIIAANGGTVGGTAPSSVTVGGSGVSGSLPTSLQISGGALNLVVGVLAKPADFTGISVNGNTLTITATNGAISGQFVLLESTNLLLPINQWTPILTNSFNGSGNLNLSTNIINPASPAEFYLLQMP